MAKVNYPSEAIEPGRVELDVIKLCMMIFSRPIQDDFSFLIILTMLKTCIFMILSDQFYC